MQAVPAAPAVPEPEHVFVIRSCNKDGTSTNNFQWPDSGPVECPDWKPVAECGNGLHGLLNGIGDWSLCAITNPTAKWYVVKVKSSEIVNLGSAKVKFPRGEVVYSGGLPGALARIAEERLLYFASVASTTGNDAPASTTGTRAPASTTGEKSTACCLGIASRAKCGPLGSIILTWWDGERYRHVVKYEGEDGIKAGVWYELGPKGGVRKCECQD